MDLILRGGRVIDPACDLDATCDVGFAGGRVAAVAPRITDKATDERDVAGAIVMPGMIDLHTHVYWGGTSSSRHPCGYWPISTCRSQAFSRSAAP